MFTRKIALGLAGGAIVVSSAFGVAALAAAETPEPTPSAGPAGSAAAVSAAGGCPGPGASGWAA